MNENFSAGIIGIGSYLPEKRMTNADLEKMVETTNDWIIERTGIRERRVAPENEATSDLAARAGKKAIEDAGLDPLDIDMVITATITPDMFFPSTACFVQAKLGLKNAGAFDLLAACSGFGYALKIADGLVRSGSSRRVLVIGAETLTKIIDWQDRGTCILFGDGAGAAVIGRVKEGAGLIGNYAGADGNQTEILYLPGGGSRFPASMESIDNRLHYIKMNGKETFKCAVKTMSDAALKVLADAGKELSDVDLLIPHQANMRIISAVGKKLDIPMEKIYVTVDKYGNISAATTIIALDEAYREGRIKNGDLVMLVAFGGGLTWSANLIKWNKEELK